MELVIRCSSLDKSHICTGNESGEPVSLFGIAVNVCVCVFTVHFLKSVTFISRPMNLIV